MEQYAFTVSESRWVEKMKEMDRALREEEAHIHWLEREGKSTTVVYFICETTIMLPQYGISNFKKTWINLRRSKSLQYECAQSIDWLEMMAYF